MTKTQSPQEPHLRKGVPVHELPDGGMVLGHVDAEDVSSARRPWNPGRHGHDSRSNAAASSRTPRRISLGSTAAKPSCNPSRVRHPRL